MIILTVRFPRMSSQYNNLAGKQWHTKQKEGKNFQKFNSQKEGRNSINLFIIINT